MRNFFYSPVASLFLFVLSSSFFLTFVTVWLESKPEVATSSIGFIHSSFYFGLLLGSIKSEELINRIGHIRSFSCFSSIVVVAILLQFLYPNILLWIVLRCCSGFCTAANYVVIESWLLAQSNKQNKGKILTIYMVSLYLAQTISQFGIDLVSISSAAPFLFAAIITSLSIIPSAMTHLPAPDIKPLPKLKLLQYFKCSPLGFCGCLISGLLLSVIYGFLPSFAHYNMLSVSTVMSVTIFGGFCLQWPIGKCSDIFDRTKITLCLGLMIVLLSILSINYFSYIGIFLLGGCCFTVYPVCIAQVCDHLENNNNIINVTGTLLFTYSIGSVCGPLILSEFIQIYSANVIFHYIAFFGLVLLILSLYTLKRVVPVDPKDQVVFIPMPRNTHIANKLDPRTQDKSSAKNNI